MKYKVKENLDINNIQESILSNRGIDNPSNYLSTTDKDIIHHRNLDNITDAANIIMSAVQDKKGIGLLVDSDFDGSCATSILYQYIKVAFNIDCKYYLHNSKEHGLSKEVMPSIITDIKNGNISLLIVSDAGTNDVDQCKELKSLGCEIIVVDHHEREKTNKYACIVNSQISEKYENKFLSGCGTTWKLLKELDDINWANYADEYLDLVAFSIISDSMDIRTLENRQLLNKGFLNIKNKFLKALIEKQSYSIKDEITPTTIAFYIVPLVNGLVRVGTQEEKEMMFKAFSQMDEFFPYIKRDKTEIQENIYERVTRLAANCKAKQDRAIEKGIEIVEADIEANNRNNNKILFALATDELDRAFSGLVAMKLASKFSKPVVLLRSNGNDYYSGSIRNFNGSPLTNLKDFLQSLDSVQWMAGHQNAAGIGLTKKQLIRTIEKSNEKLSAYDFTPIYSIDYQLTYNDITPQLLKQFYQLRFYYGQTIPESLLLLKNIKINSSQITFMGKETKDSWKFVLKDNIDVIKFKFDENDELSKRFNKSDEFGWSGSDIELDIIVKVSQSEFNGETRLLLLVQDYELIDNGSIV